MTVTNLFYWIQGYFEIGEPAAPLTPAQIDVIKRHIDPTRTLPTTPAERALLSTLGALLTAPDALKALVASYFEHVVDPLHPDPAAANQAHFGGGYPGVVRC